MRGLYTLLPVFAGLWVSLTFGVYSVTTKAAVKVMAQFLAVPVTTILDRLVMLGLG
jgi:hypothetical protein